MLLSFGCELIPLFLCCMGMLYASLSNIGFALRAVSFAHPFLTWSATDLHCFQELLPVLLVRRALFFMVSRAVI